MFYEYKDLPKDCVSIGIWLEEKLMEAGLHDPIIHNVFNLCKCRHKKEINPFSSKEFYMLLAYHALQSRSKIQKDYLKHVQMCVNPPVVLIDKSIDFKPGKIVYSKSKPEVKKRNWFTKLFKKRRAK